MLQRIIVLTARQTVQLIMQQHTNEDMSRILKKKIQQLSQRQNVQRCNQIKNILVVSKHRRQKTKRQLRTATHDETQLLSSLDTTGSTDQHSKQDHYTNCCNAGCSVQVDVQVTYVSTTKLVR